MADSLARRERRDLCDLALALGPDAPTMCEGWDAHDLVAHLVIREHRPLAAAGNAIGPLSGLTERAMERYRQRSYEVLVERYRRPAAYLRAIAPLDDAMNTFELLVHHEDLRRGGTDWQPRDLPAADVDLVWERLAKTVGLFGRKLPVPTVLRRADTGATVTAKKGEDPVTVTGPVVELVLFLFGRDGVRDLAFEGPDDAVARLRSAELGI